MSIKFRPQLLALEARDVPAAFSFQLADGTTGHGTFATPEGVNAAQAWQQLEVNDLAVSLGSTNYTSAPVPFAYYANGQLVGVVANTFNGADALDLTLSGAQLNGGSTAPIAYDAADTQLTFQFDNGVGGSISYQIPWSAVNDALPNQLLAPTAFNVNIAGQNFGSGSASFIAQPMLLFEYGDFVALQFSLNTAGLTEFDTITVDGLGVVGRAAGTGQLFETAANLPAPAAPPNADQPLSASEVKSARLLLEALAEGKKLSPQQIADVKFWLDRLGKYGVEDSGEATLKDLNRLLGGLQKVVDKPAPIFGGALEIMSSIVDQVITGITKNIKENSYAQFKLTMDNRGGQSLKDYYEANKAGFPRDFVEQFYLRYQAELLKEKLKDKK
jgi:hypothetical protein